MIKYFYNNGFEFVFLWEKVVVDIIIVWVKCCWEINFSSIIFYCNINGI